MAEVNGLLDTAHFPTDSKVFRYLTLPSEDMLDIRVLNEVLLGRDLRLKYLGFFKPSKASAEDEYRMNISDSSLKTSQQVDDSSEIIREKLESLGDSRSLAHRKLVDHAPFHAINIDLCSHFASPRGGGAPSLVRVIKQIADVQTERGADAWLLFLTTRIDRSQFDQAHRDAFIKAIQSNIQRSTLFGEQIAEMFQLSDQVEERLQDALQMSPEAFKDFFCLGFGKWFLCLLCNAYPQTAMEMLPGYYYTVQNGPDMLSLAYKCTAQRGKTRDDYDLVESGPQARPEVDEVDLAMKVVVNTRGLLDVDEVLKQNVEIFEEMLRETESFLQLASYDVSVYRDFALTSDRQAI